MVFGLIASLLEKHTRSLPFYFCRLYCHFLIGFDGMGLIIRKAKIGQ
jgi:hypothetical protein